MKNYQNKKELRKTLISCVASFVIMIILLTVYMCFRNSTAVYYLLGAYTVCSVITGRRIFGIIFSDK